MLHFQLDERVRALRSVTGGSTSCGWMYDEIGFLLYSLIKFYKPALVVQTGHLWGKSCCIMLEALTDGFLSGAQRIEDSAQSADKEFSYFVATHAASPYEAFRVISVDPNPLDVPHSAEGVDHLSRTYPAHFEFYKLSSGEFFRSYGTALKSEFNGKRILGVVDGDHSPEGCMADLANMRALGAGMIFVDDTRWLPYIGPMARAFARKHGYQFLELGHYNGVAILYKTEPPNTDILSRLAPLFWRIAGVGGLRLVCRLIGVYNAWRASARRKGTASP